MTTNYNTPDHPPILRKLVPGYEDPAWDYGDPFGQLPDHPPVLRKLVPGYEDPAWDYGDPFGQVKMLPVRLAWNSSRDTHES